MYGKLKCDRAAGDYMTYIWGGGRYCPDVTSTVQLNKK